MPFISEISGTYLWGGYLGCFWGNKKNWHSRWGIKGVSHLCNPMPYMGQTAVASRSNGWETMGKRGDACRSHAPHTAPRSRSKRHARRCGHPRTSHSNGRRPLSDVYGIGCAKLEKIEFLILNRVSTQHLYCLVGLWPQNYKKIG